MKNINTGGYAFPVIGEGVYWEGMTLRDYFAAAALQGMIASTVNEGNFPNPTRSSVTAYQFADAMLAQRDKGVK